MTPQIKHLWTSLAFNLASAVLNALLVSSSVKNGSWLWTINLVAVCLSLYMVHWCWNRIKKVKEEEKDRVVGYLSGKKVV